MIKNLPAMQEMQEAQVLSLSQEDPPEAQQLTPVFLPGESHGQKSRVGCSLQDHKESDMIKATERACRPLETQLNLLWVFIEG